MSKRQRDALLAKTMLGTAIQNISLWILRVGDRLKANNMITVLMKRNDTVLNVFLRGNYPYL